MTYDYWTLCIALLLIFYTIFYAVLMALVSICMYVMLKTLPDGHPTYTLEESLIGTNPGMGFRPQIEGQGSLIQYNVKNNTQVSKYVNALNEFLKEYESQSERSVPCTFSKALENRHQCCRVNIDDFGPCSSTNKYGYEAKRPCVFVKVNRIYGWTPEYYTTPDPDMPDDLKEYIEKLDSNQRKQIWISCAGEHPVDKEAFSHNIMVTESVTYYPSRGIPSYHYPWNQKGCNSPIIAVQFNNLKEGQIVSIRCRAWAKNIIYSSSLKELSGSTHIEILIDDDKPAT